MATVGEKLRSLRKKRGWTLQLLADKTGLSRGYLSQVERDEAGFSTEVIESLSRAYLVNPALLQHPDIELSQLEKISEMLSDLAGLSPEKLQAVHQVILALRG